MGSQHSLFINNGFRTWHWLLLGTAGLALAWGGVLGWLVYDNGRLEHGLRVQGVEVGGLTPAAAGAKVGRTVQAQLPQQLTLAHGARRWRIEAAQLGLKAHVQEAVETAYRLTRPASRLLRPAARLKTWRERPDLPVGLSFDEDRVRAVLRDVAEEIDRPPVSARIQMVGEDLRVEREVSGRRLDVEANVAQLLRQTHLPLPDHLALEVAQVPAAVAAKDLRSLDTVLASYTTDLADGYYGLIRRNRAHNVNLALSKFNGWVLAPGEVFSFNALVGPRDRENGYKTAPIFLRIDGRNEVQDRTGGGICQIATTLYNAALLANLRVLERQSHSKVVHYAPPGRDATVYYGLTDLKFRNTLAHPVAIWGEVEHYRLTVKILGSREDDVEVELVPATWTSSKGRHAALTRVVKRDGRVIKRERLSSSFYPFPPKPRPAPLATRVAQKPGSKAPADEGAAAPAPPGPLTSAPSPPRDVAPSPGPETLSRPPGSPPSPEPTSAP